MRSTYFVFFFVFNNHEKIHEINCHLIMTIVMDETINVKRSLHDTIRVFFLFSVRHDM